MASDWETHAKRLMTSLTVVVLAIFLSAIAKADVGSGRSIVVIETESGDAVEFYENSHALLIGASAYQEWPSLDSVPGEMNDVAAVLSDQGFSIEKVIDPTATELRSAFESFIQKYGYDKNNRLVFFFSGHGHTRAPENYESKGYIVPVDAPLPRHDETQFLSKALPMTQLMEWSRRIEAKHTLFLFDSCFSGSIFQTRARPPDVPPHISAVMNRPVVQFITAGGASDEVPANSVFTPALVDALRHARGDLNDDGYVTGVELGLYLRDTVPKFARQHPQFGQHRDYHRSQGDMVFVVGEQSPSTIEDKSSKQDKSSKPEVSAERVNLISPANGGGILFASSDNWSRVIAPQEHYTADLYIDDWAVFHFSDEQRAHFDTFRVAVGGSSSTNLQEFELLVSDDSPEEGFRSIGRFKARNYKSMKDLFHNIKLPPTSARYLKMRVLSSYGHGITWNWEYQLVGHLLE